MMRDYDERQLTAYLAGTLSEPEAAEFESRMLADAALRREVEAWRAAVGAASEWLEDEPLGVERAERLTVPVEAGLGVQGGGVAEDLASGNVEAGPAPVAGRPRARVLMLRPVLARALAAAALFAAGICVGSQWPRRVAPAERPPMAVAPAKEVPSLPEQAWVADPAPGQPDQKAVVGATERPKPGAPSTLDGSPEPGAAPEPEGPRGPAGQPESA